MKFLIVTGLSGAGKTSVLRHLEDSGYQCMDNIPPLLLAPAFTLCEKVELDTPVALGVDSRSGALFDADTVCSAIDQGGDSHEISILFLEADTETLIDRYKETRRDHPLMRGGITLEQAIAKEREMLQPLRERANYVLSTGGLRAKELCARVAVKISVPSARRSCPSVISVAFRARLTWCLTCAFCPIRIISRISAHTRVWKRPCATSCWAKRKPASFWGIYMNWWIICCRCTNARASAD